MFAVVRRYPLATFVVLNMVFLGLGWALLGGQLPMTPLLAALVVVPIIGGKAGLRAWASRIVRWRVGVQWYAAAILIPFIGGAIAAFLNVRLGASYTPIEWSDLPPLIPEAIFIFLLIALGEEPGFRGFAIPQLQKRFSAVNSALILSAIGVVWHIPLFLTDDSPWNVIPLIVFGYFIFVWLFNNTNGSVLLAMILHTSQNILAAKLIQPMFSGSDATRYIWLFGLVYAVFVAAILLTYRNRYLLVEAAKSPVNIVEPSLPLMPEAVPPG